MTAGPIAGAARADFQQLLTRMAGGDLAVTADDAAAVLAYLVALNAVLVQSLRVFFERGAPAATPAEAALALALHAADPGKFRFPGCESCTTPALCACPQRQAWLEACRFRARQGGKMKSDGQVA